jgi:hypothetical protein
MGSELQGHSLRLIDSDLSSCPSGFLVVEFSQPLSVPTVLLPLVPFTMQAPFLSLSRYKGEKCSTIVLSSSHHPTRTNDDDALPAALTHSHPT